jgi:hypothetical protein
VCLDDIRIPTGGKGWDIAAWQKSDGSHFSLVAGTNRIKSCDEVVADTDNISNGSVFRLAARNLLALKSALARLTPGEYITLCNGDHACADIDSTCSLGTPPTELVQDIQLYVGALGLQWN